MSNDEYRKRQFRTDDPLKKWGVFLPVGTIELLKEKAQEFDLPVARLISIAIDNELDAPNPFAYPTELPSTTFIEGAYMDEAQKIARFLRRFTIGCGRDLLMLCRRDIGIPNRQTVMFALRELLENMVVHEVKPSRKAKYQAYGPNYRFIRLVGVSREELLKRKEKMYKAEEEKSLREKSKAELTEKQKLYGGGSEALYDEDEKERL